MGLVYRVSGPLIEAKEMQGSKLYDVVKISDYNLIGEIIKIRGDHALIQVYEDTSGIKPGDKIINTGFPLSVELGPGLVGSIFDGLERPLDKIYSNSGIFISRGITLNSLDRSKKWKFIPTIKDKKVSEGAIIGYVEETSLLKHYILVPKGLSGNIEVNEGTYKLDEPIGYIDKKEIFLYQIRPVRVAAPFAKKYEPKELLTTGQRVIDTFFPIAKGGTAAIPGPFGSGKTVTLHQIAKFADANVIVYVGCGERGNEMTEVLTEFPELVDPLTNKPLMERTILIANTSNMPIAARESSVYVGVTIGEYFRDMGYSVALMADSTSRWAEALREMSSRLEEMPGEEGYPAYLASRIAEFYERSGDILALSGKKGSLSIIGAVSPPGGDISEPVSQSTLNIVKVFWALDAQLANTRHFPAINWLKSYSLYFENLEDYYSTIAKDFIENRNIALNLLQMEDDIKSIAQIVGTESLPEEEKLILEIGKIIREGFLRQNAFDPIDSYTNINRQYYMLKIIIHLYEKSKEALLHAKTKDIMSLQIVKDVMRMKDLSNDEFEKNKEILIKRIDDEISKLGVLS